MSGYLIVGYMTMSNEHVHVIGPFADAYELGSWYAEHQSDVDDWLDWKRDLGRPFYAFADEENCIRPALWLKNLETAWVE